MAVGHIDLSLVENVVLDLGGFDQNRGGDFRMRCGGVASIPLPAAWVASRIGHVRSASDSVAVWVSVFQFLGRWLTELRRAARRPGYPRQ